MSQKIDHHSDMKLSGELIVRKVKKSNNNTFSIT